MPDLDLFNHAMRRRPPVKNEVSQGGQTVSVELTDVRLKNVKSSETFVLLALSNIEHLYDFLNKLFGAQTKAKLTEAGFQEQRRRHAPNFALMRNSNLKPS